MVSTVDNTAGAESRHSQEQERSSEGLVSGWFFKDLDYPPESEITHPAEVSVRTMLAHLSVAEIMDIPVAEED